MVEREFLMTGIGGQGVQLAAKTLAVAAIRDGREVMTFGTYGGSMRGGETDATVVIGDGPLLAPPTVDEAWAALAMHHLSWATIRGRMRKGGVIVVDTSVFRGETAVPGSTVIGIDATTKALAMGNPRAGSMIALGVLVAATGIVSLEALAGAAHEVLPPYRVQHAEANVAALRAGHALIEAPRASAWPAGARRAA